MNSRDINHVNGNSVTRMCKQQDIYVQVFRVVLLHVQACIDIRDFFRPGHFGAEYGTHSQCSQNSIFPIFQPHFPKNLAQNSQYRQAYVKTELSTAENVLR